jgi:hypothetical protein
MSSRDEEPARLYMRRVTRDLAIIIVLFIIVPFVLGWFVFN